MTWPRGRILAVLSLVATAACGADESAKAGEGSTVEPLTCATGAECDSGCCLATGLCAPSASCQAQTCPGQSIAVDSELRALRPDFVLDDDLRTHCAPPETVDAVYALKPTRTGSLTLEATQASVQLRTDCVDESTTIACVQDGRLTVAVQEDEALFAVVEYPATGSGQVTTSLDAATCGDGAVNAGEECDFGDRTAEDGCDEHCRFEAPDPDADHCPAYNHLLHPGETFEVSAHNVGYQDAVDAPCGALDGGRDLVYRFTIAMVGNGALELQLAAEFDAVLGLYAGCRAASVTELLACSDGEYPLDREILVQPVTGGSVYYAVVDAFHPLAMGRFTLTAALTGGEEVSQ